MKKLMIQIIIILAVSIAIGLTYNQFINSPVPVFKKYIPDAKTDRITGEDLSIYYNEMDIETLVALKEADSITLLDARDPMLFEQGHIPGAISCPIAKFNEMYDSIVPLLEEGKTIVIYCINVQCTDSSLLAREMNKKGHLEIFVFKGGIEEWTEMGYPVQTPDGIKAQNGMNEYEETELQHENEN